MKHFIIGLILIACLLMNCANGHYRSSYTHMTHSKPSNVQDCLMLEGRLEQLGFEVDSLKIKAESGLMFSDSDIAQMYADLQSIANEAVEISRYGALCRSYKNL